MKIARAEVFALSAAALICLALSPPATHSQTQVFRCTANGVVTFSDRPCGEDAQSYEADESRISTFTPPSKVATSRTAAVSQPKPAAPANRESIAEAQAKHAESCARIARSLSEIRSHMRAGYNAKQGERLNKRQRKLTAQRREQRC